MDVPKPLSGGPSAPTLRVGPTGLERIPFGEAHFEDLVNCYKQQLTAPAGVWAAGLSDLADARAALLAAAGRDVWVTFRCDGEGRTDQGTDVLAALIVMRGMGCAAFGVETDGPEDQARQLERIAPYATVPLLWTGDAPAPEGLTSLALGTVFEDPDVLPCASEKEARFITPDVDVGESLRCTPELLEDILAAEEERPQGALKVEILDEDDLLTFAANQYAIRDALCLWSDVPELLERALRIYQGRAFWDGTGALEPEFLARMSRTYGLVLL